MSLSRATVSLDQNAAWSDGSPFNGSLLLRYNLPELGTGNYPFALINGLENDIEAPYQVELPIRDGVLDPSDPKILRTDLGITPPSAKVLDFWIDSTGALIAVGTLSTVAASTKVFTVPALNVPTAETDIPQLEGLNKTGIQNFLTAGLQNVTRDVLTGTGTNFTLSRVPTLAIVYFNGQILVSPEDYTLTGTSLVLTFSKGANDVLEVILLG